MYNIYLLQQNSGSVILLDNANVIEATVDRKINTADAFSMMWTGEGFTGTIQAFTFGIMVKDQDNEIIFGGRIISTERDMYGIYHIEAEGALAYLNDYVVGPYEVTKANGWDTSKKVKGIYNYVLNAYSAVASAGTSTWNFLDMKASYCTVDNSGLLSGASSKDYQSCLECIKSLLVDTCGLILDVRYTAYDDEFVPKLYVRASNYSTSSAQELKLGDNILDVKITTDYSDLCTRVFAFGAQKENSDKRLTLKDAGQTSKALTDTTARNKYGMIARTVIYNNVTNPATLLKKAQAYLDEHKVPKSTIEISAVDLHIADTSINKFHLLDKVNLEVATQHYSGTVQIKALHYDLVNVEKSAITCESNFTTQAGSLSSKLEKAVADIAESGYNAVVNNSAISDTIIKKLQDVSIATSGNTATITFAEVDPSTGEAVTNPLTITAQKIEDNSTIENGAYVVKQGTEYFKINVPTLTEEQLEAVQGVTIEAEVLGTKIVAETIEADTLKVNQAFANKIFAQDITATGTIAGARLIGSEFSATDGLGRETLINKNVMYIKGHDRFVALQSILDPASIQLKEANTYKMDILVQEGSSIIEANTDLELSTDSGMYLSFDYLRINGSSFADLFVVDTVTSAVGANIAANGTQTIQADCTKAGYKPLAVVGYQLLGSSNQSSMNTYRVLLTGTTAEVRVRNVHASTAVQGPYVTFFILYVKNI